MSIKEEEKKMLILRGGNFDWRKRRDNEAEVKEGKKKESLDIKCKGARRRRQKPK